MTCLIPRATPRWASWSSSVPAEEHRRKGVGTALLRQLIARFEANGGLALLCTTGPGAGRLYESCGFDYFVGDGMRYLSDAAGDFDAGYLAPRRGCLGPRGALGGTFRAPRCCSATRSPAWEIKEYLSHCFRETRFEGHFTRLMRRVEEDRGFILVLENPRRRVAGCAIAERLPTFHQQHVAQLSVRVAPEYVDQTGELLAAAASRAHRMGICVLQAYAAEADGDAGEGPGAGGVRARGGTVRGACGSRTGLPAWLFTAGSSRKRGPRRPRHEYYGERKPWQTERILAKKRKGEP